MSKKVTYSSDELEAFLARAHIRGLGDEVMRVWRMISEEQLSDETALAWVRVVAEWITTTDSPARTRTPGGAEVPKALLPKPGAPVPRVARIHAALVISGWAEPQLDTLDDDYLILCFAKAGLRSAAEGVWALIATGKAAQGIREEWLDHVAKGVNDVNRDITVGVNRRGDAMLSKLGLSGKRKGTSQRETCEIIYRVVAMFPQAAYEAQEHKYVSAIIKLMQKLGALEENLSDQKLEEWKSFIRKEIAKRPPPIN